DHRRMAGFPYGRVDVLSIRRDHHGGGHFLALLPREVALRHRREPDVGIKPDLVAGVAAQRRAATWLRDVADQQPRPARDLRGLLGEPFEEPDEVRMAPVAVARAPHELA